MHNEINIFNESKIYSKVQKTEQKKFVFCVFDIS